MARARDTGEPVATEPIRLVQEPGSQHGFLVFHPVFASDARTSEERQKSLRGFAVAVFRVGDLVDRIRITDPARILRPQRQGRLHGYLDSREETSGIRRIIVLRQRRQD